MELNKASFHCLFNNTVFHMKTSFMGALLANFQIYGNSMVNQSHDILTNIYPIILIGCLLNLSALRFSWHLKTDE